MAMAVPGGLLTEEIMLIVGTAAISSVVSFLVFIGCFYWVTRHDRLLQNRVHKSVKKSTEGREIFVTGKEAFALGGELVAQFRVNQGKQVVSVLEAEGRRFIHVDGDLSGAERAKMVRYLKSEGFMS